MAETVRERHFRDRLESVRQLASAREASAAATVGREFEDLVALCVELSASGQDLIAKEYGRIFKDASLTVGWLQERRRIIEELSDRYLQLAESIKTCALQEGAGAVQRQDLVILLDSGIKAVVDAKNTALERWPVGGPEEAVAAAASIARGETLPVDEAFADIAGTDVQTWQKSVEEYKLRRQQQPG